ncbi:hypothetical protein C7974DRAFT_466782 [Boeremia exigua]|uniref:uncharacterized protein n=1 Tax=Boeremia exigua TaxID=749465 RepID=UPI001E8DC6C4|nr:uncharacterized protein C7974DRAFT_466782 [Boeremia exigua]KAH6612355.1 hypothetical protein C7974DRAFT_466782 [Boeremia exigua]
MSAHFDIATFLHPDLCANKERKEDTTESPCQDVANLVCRSCRLAQYCTKECQITDWPRHKKTCKSDIMKSVYVPGWIREGRGPSWVSDNELSSKFGSNQYLWGNMPAVSLLRALESKSTDRDVSLLFAASGDLRNVVKSTVEGLPDGHKGRFLLVINDINFMIVARNAILLFVALSLEANDAVPIMMHLWYSALLPRVMVETLVGVVLGPIAQTFSFRRRSLRITLMKHQWDKLNDYLHVPTEMTQEDAQDIRRRVMLAAERVDYLHRALCNQPPSFRVATVTFRNDGMLLPHGASREEFDTPNPSFFHEDRTWPMMDDASPLDGWNYHEYIKFAPRASNDIMGSFFFFLRDTLLCFCKRIEDIDIHFQLFNVDARELPRYLSTEESFDCIEVSNICDRGYVGFERVLSTFGPLLKSKAVSPHATLLMLFLNAVGEVYEQHDRNGQRRFRESRRLMQQFIPLTPQNIMSMMVGDAMSSPEMIRISSCYTMFGDLEKAFGVYMEETQMYRFMQKHGMKIKRKDSIVEPWPLRITEETTLEEFAIRCATSHTGCERYMEFERL